MPGQWSMLHCVGAGRMDDEEAGAVVCLTRKSLVSRFRNSLKSVSILPLYRN